MRWIRYILFLLVLLFTMTGIRAQYINVVCAGDSGVVYKVQGSEGSTFNWSVGGGSIVYDWGDSISVQWGTQPGEYTLRVQEISRHGCPALPVSGIVLVSGPDVDVGPDLEICEGAVIIIEATGSFYSMLWHDGSTGSSIIAGTGGWKKVVVEDDYGCKAADSLYLTVNPLPLVDLGPDTSLCGSEEIILDAGSDGVRFNWSTGERTREIIAFEGRKTIWVEVVDGNNCVSWDTINIRACSLDERFAQMPTAFTPNGDGKNDVWRIPELEPFSSAVVEIFDRWGNLVFRSAPGYSDPWDGVSADGRTMPMDSYYFVIDLGDGITQPLVGTVTIIK
jgi:gliding motility-associated-like protein